MIRIGIVWSENVHAAIFAGLANHPDPATGRWLTPEARITAIWGADGQAAREIAQTGEIPTVVDRPEDLLDMVDAVMVIHRLGSRNLASALPFLERGIPTWIDKPMALTTEDMIALLRAAHTRGTLLSGGSTLRYAPDVRILAREARGEGRIGELRTGMVSFETTHDSPHGGLHFYGTHVAQIALEVFGYDPRDVVARERGGTVTAILGYDRYQATLEFVPHLQVPTCVLFGEKGTMVREIDITHVFRDAYLDFVRVLRTGSGAPTHRELYAPVELVAAVVESVATGRTVPLRGWNG